jgi:hypothetical protein
MVLLTKTGCGACQNLKQSVNMGSELRALLKVSYLPVTRARTRPRAYPLCCLVQCLGMCTSYRALVERVATFWWCTLRMIRWESGKPPGRVTLRRRIIAAH